MLYLLWEWLRGASDIPGLGLLQYISFRAAGAAISALIISFFFGPSIIRFLKKKQIGEAAKHELQGVGQHSVKAGTPTMGGIIVLLAVLLPTLIWANMLNALIVIIFITTLWLGLVGFLDDYLKVVKKLPNGLIGRYKLIGQIFIGLIVGCILYFSPESFGTGMKEFASATTVPFEKDINFDFGYFYIPVVVFIITATSNAVNLTDGLDGLAIGTVGISSLAMALITYFSGHAVFSNYLNIMYIPGAGELTIFTAAIVGASLGFLWYNSYPAQVFMGDTGSLALGGALGTLCILVKKEFLLPIVGGIFLAETLSVIIQTSYFKFTRKKYGVGKRIFKMAPLHHHFEKSGWHESKIVTRFYIAAVLLAIIAMTTFKVR